MSTPSARWKQIVTKSYGLNFWENFASQNGKPLTIPEWGLSTGANGGGDDPYFITQMYNWMRGITSGSRPTSTIRALTSGSFAQSAAEYRELYSARGGATSSAAADPRRGSCESTASSPRISGRPELAGRPDASAELRPRCGPRQGRARRSGLRIDGRESRLRVEVAVEVDLSNHAERRCFEAPEPQAAGNSHGAQCGSCKSPVNHAAGEDPEDRRGRPGRLPYQPCARVSLTVLSCQDRPGRHLPTELVSELLDRTLVVVSGHKGPGEVAVHSRHRTSVAKLFVSVITDLGLPGDTHSQSSLP